MAADCLTVVRTGVTEFGLDIGLVQVKCSKTASVFRGYGSLEAEHEQTFEIVPTLLGRGQTRQDAQARWVMTEA